MKFARLKQAITERLATHNFVPQRRDSNLFFVRTSEVVDLFERIEFVFVGRDKEAAVLTMAIAVVQSIGTHYTGLLERGVLPSLYTDPENGRVELASDQVQGWLDRLGHVAPPSVTAFAQERGPELLRRTELARSAAMRAFVRHVQPALSSGLDAVVDSLDSKQRAITQNLSTRPLFIGSDELRHEYEVALAALIMAEDADLLQLGEAPVPAALGRAFIKQVNEVRDEVIWKIRILVDIILRARGDAHAN